MTKARFRVDPRLTVLLGEGYRTSEHALKELIDNAWDADASTVRVTLPPLFTEAPVVVVDDGTGMTEAEVRRDYLAVASSRQSRKGDLTVERKRPVKGRKGIGKFAGLVVADTMTIETRCRGTRTVLVIRKEDLASVTGADVDLESIDLPLTVSPCDAGERGTTVTLTGLSQVFDPPAATRLRPLLMLEYGRREEFSLFVNGEAVGILDIPGDRFEASTTLPDIGLVELRFNVSDGKKPLPRSGIAIRVRGKMVARPTTFRLDEDEEVPSKLLRKVYGELEADGLLSSVTGDWGDVVETRAYAAVEAWAARELKAALEQVFRKEMQLARARLSQEVMRRLAQLPENRRPAAERRIERILVELYGEHEDRITAVVNVALDAIEHDSYYAVVHAVDEARTVDVARFAEALDQFGLADLVHIGVQARNRAEFLDRLDTLIANPKTREVDVHRALEHNLWVLGVEYGLLASNTTLRRIVEDVAKGGPYKGDRQRERPDLLLVSGPTGRHVLIEFKRPGIDITRVHEAQAATYRDELVRQFDGIDVVLIGRGWALGSDRTNVPPGLTVLSYAAVVSRARRELTWLLDQLNDPKTPTVAESATPALM